MLKHEKLNSLPLHFGNEVKLISMSKLPYSLRGKKQSPKLKKLIEKTVLRRKILKGKMINTAGVALILIWIFVILWSVTIGESQESVNSNRKIEWRHNGLDINGNVEVISGFEVGVYTKDDLSDLEVKHKIIGDTRDFNLTILNEFEGTKFNVVVRAIDQAGNLSDWSLPLFIDLDSIPPDAPGQIRVIRVTIEEIILP